MVQSTSVQLDQLDPAGQGTERLSREAQVLALKGGKK